MGMRGIWELLDGKIWEWDLSFRWEWKWDGNGNEVIEMGGIWYEKSIPARLYFKSAPTLSVFGKRLKTYIFLFISFLFSAVQQFLANVNSSSRLLYVIDGPSVVCRLSVVCNVGAPYSGD